MSYTVLHFINLDHKVFSISIQFLLMFQGRKNGSIKIWGEAGKDRDEFSWLLCTNRQAHEQEKLMLTQIIAGDSLLQLGKKVHDVRALCCIPQYCGCPMSKENPLKSTNGICKVIST